MVYTTKIKVSELRITFGSFLVALLILSKNLLQISEFVFGSTAIFKIGFVLLGAFSIVYFQRKLYMNDIFVFVILFIFFVFSWGLHNNSVLIENLQYFLIYGLAGYAYSFAPVDKNRVYRFCIIIGIIWLLLYIATNGVKITDSFSFGYLMLPLTVCGFLQAASPDCGKAERVISVILFLFFFFQMLLNGSRGPLVCVILFIMLFLIPLAKNSKKRILIYCIFGVSIIALLNYQTIILTINDMFPGKFALIEKSILLLNQSHDITNGRMDIISIIFEQYSLSDFIFGIGIGMYESTHLIQGYTHNLFFSMLLDYGIVGVAVFILSIKVFISNIMNVRNDYIILLFAVSYIPLMFSGTYWQSFQFWLFVFTITKLGNYRRRENTLENNV